MRWKRSNKPLSRLFYFCISTSNTLKVYSFWKKQTKKEQSYFYILPNPQREQRENHRTKRETLRFASLPPRNVYSSGRPRPQLWHRSSICSCGPAAPSMTWWGKESLLVYLFFDYNILFKEYFVHLFFYGLYKIFTRVLYVLFWWFHKASCSFSDFFLFAPLGFLL